MSDRWRRRRSLRRRLRELDRLDRQSRSGVLGSAARPHRNAGPGRAVAGLTLVASIALAVAVVLFTPGVAPPGLLNAVGLGPTPLGHPPSVVVGGPHNFLTHQPNSPSQPVAWDPCRAIHYQVNPAGGPTDAVRLVRSAVAEVSAATGLEFVYDGVSTQRPDWKARYSPVGLNDRPVQVTWATSVEVPALSGKVAGLGGAVSEIGRGGRRHYVSGAVTLDTDSFTRIPEREARHTAERAVLLHELGHVVGLAHVRDRGQLMYPSNHGQVDFGPGDREGLAVLGTGPCF